MSATFSDVSFLFKRKLVEKLMAQFQVELTALMNDAGYKSLPPEQQMFAISELTHWWSSWFLRMPDPSLDHSDDYSMVSASDVDSSSLIVNKREFNWYAYLLSLAQPQSNLPWLA